MSGRISALAGYDDASGKLTVFVGAASGGVWKSTDGGTTFKPVFDEQPVQSIGAIAHRPDASRERVGRDGRILDAQQRLDRRRHLQVHRWRRDLDATRASRTPSASPRSSSIRAPPDTVYACVPGKLWSDSADRGLYKTTDGGKTWQLILKGANLSTGCGSVAMQPREPRRAAREPVGLPPQRLDFPLRRRRPQGRLGQRPVPQRATAARPGPSSPPQSNKGLPAKPYGRIALAFAPSDAADRLRLHRVDRLGAVHLARRRRDLGSGRQEHSGWCGGRSISPTSSSTRRTPSASSRPTAR